MNLRCLSNYTGPSSSFNERCNSCKLATLFLKVEKAILNARSVRHEERGFHSDRFGEEVIDKVRNNSIFGKTHLF